MQSIAPPLDLNPTERSQEEILAALRAPVRRFSFRYKLLDMFNATIRDLDNVISCKITQNWLADIKRTATFTIRETGGIDYLSDRIQPYIRLHLPPYGHFDYVEWPQGVFLLASPKRHVDDGGVITRQVDAYDMLQIFADDAVDTRYTVASATQYMTAVRSLLGIGAPGRRPWAGPVQIPKSTANLPTAREWPPGTSKLKIVNELLDALNYESLSFSENGNPVLRQYVSPADRSEEFTYDTGKYGLILPEVDQELDLFSVPNKWVLVRSEPELPPIVSTYTNANPSSPTSTVRRGRTIVDFREEQEAADQATLDAKAQRLAFEASQVYESMEFSTALMPFHSGNDVYVINESRLSVAAKYAEHSWEMELRAGAPMKHRARRVVSV